MRILFFLLLILSCNRAFIIDCDTDNYFISKYENDDSGFQNNQREIVTTLSEKELDLPFNEMEMSCKDVLANFFYCNICFNNQTNYLVSYNGSKFDLSKIEDPQIFTNNVIKLISSMQMGAEEYAAFLKVQKNNFSKEENKLLKDLFESQKKDNIIKSIKIQTH